MGQFLPWLDDPDGFHRPWGDDTGLVSALIVFDTLEPAGVRRLAAAIRFAGRVGSERVVFCHDHSRTGVTEADVATFGRQLSAVGADAAAQGVKLSLHHHHGHPVMNPSDVRAFFAAVEPGTVGLTVDTGHLAKSGVVDIAEFIAEFADVTDNVHLKDFADGQWQLLGRGELDLEGVLAALDTAGYPGWLCVDEESAADLGTGFAESKRWLDTRG